VSSIHLRNQRRAKNSCRANSFNKKRTASLHTRKADETDEDAKQWMKDTTKLSMQ
jgi:hypothetical protein